MSPSRTTTVKSKHAANKSGVKNSKHSAKPQGDGVSKSRKPPKSSAPPLKSVTGPVRKKRKVYTEKELEIPKLNMITPVGVEKPKGKKKGKVFVDDKESMLTILALVNADKDGQIESKMMKARQMEEIREARRVEAEKRQEMRKSKLHEAKEAIRKKRNRGGEHGDAEMDAVAKEAAVAGTRPFRIRKKRVSFASN